MIPAGDRVGITVRGHLAEFSQLNVPTQLLEHRDLTPRFGYRDPLLHLLTNRVHSIVGREDLLGRLLRDSLTEVTQLHLSDHYTSIRRRRIINQTLSPAIQAKLIELIDDGMDSDLSLRLLAERAGMTTTTFIKNFTDAFHTMPYQ